jgi:isoleucyl-tRNA synthetase
MDIAQSVVSLTRSMRAKANLKIRQPLKKMMVVINKSKSAALENMKDVILDEVNIKELIVLDNDAGIVNKSAKANFKGIGPKFGKKANPVANRIKSMTKQEISLLEANGVVTLVLDGEEISISKSDVEIISTEIEGWVVESEEGVTIAIDTELNNELIAEGFAREFVNRVQNMRKDAGFEVTDRIEINFLSNSNLSDAIKLFHNYISNETLADKINPETNFNGGINQNWKIGEYDCSIQIARVNTK